MQLPLAIRGDLHSLANAATFLPESAVPTVNELHVWFSAEAECYNEIDLHPM